MGFKLENIGIWSPDRVFEVDVERTKAYARATNDPITEHTTGELAPPNFTVVPATETGVAEEAGSDVLDLTPEEAMRILHGEQDLVIHQPIRPGMRLRVRGATVGVHAKSSGTTVVKRVETTDADGAAVNTQYFTLFYRGVVAHTSAGESALPRSDGTRAAKDEPIAEVTQRIDDDQTYRYAAASGDHMPIHIDEAAARAAGLPGVIVHGLCTMAFASHALITSVAGGDPRRLGRLAMRFSRTVFPGQEITTRVFGGGNGSYAFETLNSDGQQVLKDGLAEVTG